MRYSIIIITLLAVLSVNGQQTGYYNGTDGKDGETLKTALHDIIKGHTPYSYFASKHIFKVSDADPNTPGNVILFYTGRSEDGDNYGTGGNFINREHVWAKSHGNFVDRLPMYSDVHNLKPADASVNVDKSNKDFDNGGIQHSEATGCYYTDSTWEARDEVKGDVARIIFYMSTRYEGDNGEIDLEVVDWNNTYPHAQHGKLSTLLQWNIQDPPDDFERNRNNVIFSFQRNRNPFIDNPELAQLIWGGETASPISIDDIQIAPEVAVASQPSQINSTITTTAGNISSAKIWWGLNYESLTNEISMTNSGNVFTGNIPGQPEDAHVYYKIIATDGTNEKSSIVYSYYVPKIFTGDLVSIYDIQGQQDDSPYINQVVSTTGIITGNFGTYYFLQNGTGLWNGLFIYESGRDLSIGDSVIITGTITEYFGKTEMSNITDYYYISSNNTLPEPVVIGTGEAEEGHESIIVQVKNAVCTVEDYQADHYMWAVNDGSGELKIHNTSIFEYVPALNLIYDITGPLNYDFDEWKIELRYESDVISSVDTDGPTVESIEPVLNTNIKIMFNEAVEESTATNFANYTIDNDVVIESISQHAFNKAEIHLTVSSLTPGTSYTTTISNIADLAGNIMYEHTQSFTFVGIEELFTDGALTVFPNPAKDKISISFNAKDQADLQISLNDLSGKQVFSNKYTVAKGLNQLSMDVNGQSKGVYVLNLVTEKGTINYKVVIK
ncbi:MAG: endonuclease [Bacteroidales bacterium]|jgi:endonuclease I